MSEIEETLKDSKKIQDERRASIEENLREQMVKLRRQVERLPNYTNYIYERLNEDTRQYLKEMRILQEKATVYVNTGLADDDFIDFYRFQTETIVSNLWFYYTRNVRDEIKKYDVQKPFWNENERNDYCEKYHEIKAFYQTLRLLGCSSMDRDIYIRIDKLFEEN